MGQYRFSINIHYMLGLCLKIDEYSIDIDLLCFRLEIAISKYARGYNFFGRWTN